MGLVQFFKRSPWSERPPVCSASHRTDRICMEKGRFLWKGKDARYKTAYRRDAYCALERRAS
jgi:hypothetical protein